MSKIKKKYQKSKWKKVIDKAIYVIAFFGIIMTLPQVYNIWIGKNAIGVSAISWIAYLVVAITWLAYGLVHKYKPIIYSNCLWIVLDLFIISGVFIYG
tara:strand:+ start:403 stop:696 length:294 start_codon:yes stop_codon:yes gene_type:complete